MTMTLLNQIRGDNFLRPAEGGEPSPRRLGDPEEQLLPPLRAGASDEPVLEGGAGHDGGLRGGDQGQEVSGGGAQLHHLARGNWAEAHCRGELHISLQRCCLPEAPS